jgi:Holliday junction DNA helicase RuvA
MIATLRGQVVEKNEQLVVLEVGGVGYGVRVTVSDLGRLKTDSETKLYIHEHIKDDAHDLFGFISADTRSLFRQLLSVKNVGPKAATAILDIGSVDEVRMAIASGDVKRIQTAKGVGKRAAEQVVVELRDKVGLASTEGAENVVGRGGIDQRDEAVVALVSLGYDEIDAMSALQNIDKKLPLEERVKLALKGTR